MGNVIGVNESSPHAGLSAGFAAVNGFGDKPTRFGWFSCLCSHGVALPWPVESMHYPSRAFWGCLCKHWWGWICSLVSPFGCRLSAGAMRTTRGPWTWRAPGTMTPLGMMNWTMSTRARAQGVSSCGEGSLVGLERGLPWDVREGLPLPTSGAALLPFPRQKQRELPQSWAQVTPFAISVSGATRQD